MGKQLLRVSLFMLYFLTSVINASPVATQRVAQFSNNKVSVWKTIIFPSVSQGLKMHRHDHDRVLVALDDGKLKITNDKGKVHYLNLKKDKAYYLSRDIPGELHGDENVTSHPIKVMVIELND